MALWWCAATQRSQATTQREPWTSPVICSRSSTQVSFWCRKLSTIPFPFPHAQIVTATLVLFTLTLPLMVAAFIRSPIQCAGVAALTAVLYWGAHEVARELEDPFLIWSSTYNCLPFTSLQWGFNEDILAFAYSMVCPHPTAIRFHNTHLCTTGVMSMLCIIANVSRRSNRPAVRCGRIVAMAASMPAAGDQAPAFMRAFPERSCVAHGYAMSIS